MLVQINLESARTSPYGFVHVCIHTHWGVGAISNRIIDCLGDFLRMFMIISGFRDFFGWTRQSRKQNVIIRDDNHNDTNSESATGGETHLHLHVRMPNKWILKQVYAVSPNFCPWTPESWNFAIQLGFCINKLSIKGAPGSAPLFSMYFVVFLCISLYSPLYLKRFYLNKSRFILPDCMFFLRCVLEYLTEH